MRAMTRFFREYGRVLLLCFMAMLLVIWLIQDTMGNRGGRGQTDDSSIVFGTAFGRSVTRADTARAESDVVIFQNMIGPNRQLPGPMTASDLERQICWHLLAEEAKQAGVRVGRAQVEELLRAEPGASERFNFLARQHHRSQDGMFQAIGRIMAVYQYIEWQAQGGGGESLPRIELEYRDRKEKAEAKVSAIHSKAFLPRVAEPTEEELAKHFEESKGRAAAHTETTHTFGYLVPDRVQIEYVTISPSELINTVEVRDREARKYFEDNRGKYVRVPEVPSPPMPGQPAPTPVQLSYEEAREQVKNDFRAVKAAEEAQRIINQIRDEARQPWDAVPRPAGGPRGRPAEAAIVTLESLVAKYSSRAPIKHVKTELIDERGVSRLSDIGGARIMVNRQPISAIQAIMNVDGLAPRASLTEEYRLRPGEPGPVVQNILRGPSGDVRPTQSYAFRVIQAVPSGPPASLDEVRAKVIEDVKLLKAHALAGEAAGRLAERAREVGLDAAVAEATELKELMAAADAVPPPATQPGEPPAPARTNAKDLEPAVVPEFSRGMLSAMNTGASRELSRTLFEATTQPVAEGRRRVAQVSMARSDRWLVGELVSLKPLYEETFKKEVRDLRQALDMGVQREFMFAWLSPESIRSRTGFTPDKSMTESAQ